MNTLNVKKGDQVVVLTGKDKGKKGTILACDPSSNRVIVKEVNVQKKHIKARNARDTAGIVEMEGYFEGGGYAVTWAFGHLVQLAMPDGYGVRGFVRDNLPIIPDTFTLVPRQVRTEKGYKPDSGVVSQIKIIKRLFDTSDQIIVATDAGREGELIFR